LCNSEPAAQLRALVFGPDFVRNLALILAPAPLFLAVAVTRSPLVRAGLVLGVGLGGFVDGIVFHQLLQLHSMLSALYPPTSVLNLEHNMVWDGVFHVFTWCTTVLGVVLLWRAGARRDVAWCGRTLAGAGLCGWGAFNLVEGVIDHFVLQIHHVVERQGLSIWDGVFLASGVILIAVGLGTMRSTRAPVGAPRPA
jgi:uncharacterized membrane protein